METEIELLKQKPMGGREREGKYSTFKYLGLGQFWTDLINGRKYCSRMLQNRFERTKSRQESFDRTICHLAPHYFSPSLPLSSFRQLNLVFLSFILSMPDSRSLYFYFYSIPDSRPTDRSTHNKATPTTPVSFWARSLFKTFTINSLQLTQKKIPKKIVRLSFFLSQL